MSDPAGAITRRKTWTEPTWTATNLELNKSIFRLNNPAQSTVNSLICGPRWFDASGEKCVRVMRGGSGGDCSLGPSAPDWEDEVGASVCPPAAQRENCRRTQLSTHQKPLQWSERSGFLCQIAPRGFLTFFTEVKMQSSQTETDILKIGAFFQQNALYY